MLDSKFKTTTALLHPASTRRTFISPSLSGPVHADFQNTAIEPFPPYIEPPADILALLHAPYPPEKSWPRIRRVRRSMEGVAHQVRLRHYQYEVTFGLYMLTGAEKALLNGLLVLVLGMMLYGTQAAMGMVLATAARWKLALVMAVES